MSSLSAFLFLSLDGYYKDVNNSTSWHHHDEEGGKFSAENLKANNTLCFGRVTYEMMAGFWPTPQAAVAFPEVAAAMNKANKIVFSNTLKRAEWENTKVISGNIGEEMKKLKAQSTNDFTILGSGSIITHFANLGLIDAFQFMIDPVALGEGTSVFSGLHKTLDLKLTGTLTFKSGAVILNYTKKEVGI